MPQELFKDNRKEKLAPDEIYNARVNVIVKGLYNECNKIVTPSIQMHVSSMLDILSNMKLEADILDPLATINKVTKILDQSIKEFDEYKNTALQKMLAVKLAHGNQNALSAMDTPGFKDNMRKNIIQKKYDFSKASKIIKKIKASFNDPLLKSKMSQFKKKLKTDKVKNMAGGLASAMTGSAFPMMIPSLYKGAKDKIKDFKQASGKGKLLMGLQGASLALGTLTGSNLGMMGASYLGQKVNSEKQSREALNNSIKENNRIKKISSLKHDVRGGEFSYASLQSDNGYGMSLLGDKKTRTSLFEREQTNINRGKPLTATQKQILKGLTGNEAKEYKAELESEGYFISAKNGGNFAVKGGNSSGMGSTISNLAVHEGESVKVTPKEDPVLKEVKETNKLLEELVQSNKDMLEDQAEANAREGLKRKQSEKDEKTNSIFKKSDPEKKVETKDGLGITDIVAGNLVSKLLPMIFTATTLGPIIAVALPLIAGAALLGGLFAGIKDTLDYRKKLKKGEVGWETDEAGNNVLTDTTKAGKEKQAQAQKANDDWNAQKNLEDPNWKSRQEKYDNGSLYAKGGSFETTGPHNMQVGEAGKERVNVTPINKPLPVIIQDDKSTLGQALFKQIKDEKKRKDFAPLKSNSTVVSTQTPSLWDSAKNTILGTPDADGNRQGGFKGAIKNSLSWAGNKVSGLLNGGLRTNVPLANGQVEERQGGTKSWRNNNPGNLRFANQSGAVGQDENGFAVFKDMAEGELARKRQVFDLNGKRDNFSIEQLIYKYAPPSENNTEKYIEVVAKAVGVPRTTKLTSLNESQQNAMMEAMKKHEGFTPGLTKVVPKDKSTLLASNATNVNTPIATAKNKTPKEGSIKNIKSNATQGAEVTQLRNKEVSIDASINAQNAKSTEQAINNVNIGGSSHTSSPQPKNTFTGDQVSFLTRLTRGY